MRKKGIWPSLCQIYGYLCGVQFSTRRPKLWLWVSREGFVLERIALGFINMCWKWCVNKHPPDNIKSEIIKKTKMYFEKMIIFPRLHSNIIPSHFVYSQMWKFPVCVFFSFNQDQRGYTSHNRLRGKDLCLFWSLHQYQEECLALSSYHWKTTTFANLED